MKAQPTDLTQTNTALESCARQVAHVPAQPGVYIMKDRRGRVLYVGKARHLKKRLQSYFQKGRPHDHKTAMLMTKVASFDTVITHTEKEAFILESNLIKRHRPRYNVVLKDDKRYPSLRLNLSQPFPNLNIVRKIQNDGALYFGPYTSSAAVRQTVKFIHKTFKLRKCRTSTFMNRTRPCLNYQMGLCLGPCCLEVDPKVYHEIVKEVIAFLRGRTPELIRKVKRQMQTAASNHDFEQAASLRDKMYALEKTLERQVSVISDFKDRDVIGSIMEEGTSVVTLLRVRGGFLLGGGHFFFDNALGGVSDQMSAFIKQYYAGARTIPAEIVVSHSPVDKSLVENLLGDKKGAKVRIVTPQRGEKHKLVQMALNNAHNEMQEHLRKAEVRHDLLRRLQKRLHLDRLPQRIECFDNSSLAGTEPVAGMVVFENGNPQPDAYRKYRLKPLGKPDDYAYMAEVLRRRYVKGEEAKPLPDLLLVDGGKGQLNVAMAILGELKMAGAFKVAGIAKKDQNLGEQQDKIYLAKRSNPIQFGSDADVLLFLQRIRDEAHRWALTFQKKRRMKRTLHSKLDGITGIGPKRKALLLHCFGSLDKIASAPVDEIEALPGFSKGLVRTIKQSLASSVIPTVETGEDK